LRQRQNASPRTPRFHVKSQDFPHKPGIRRQAIRGSVNARRRRHSQSTSSMALRKHLTHKLDFQEFPDLAQSLAAPHRPDANPQTLSPKTSPMPAPSAQSKP